MINLTSVAWNIKVVQDEQPPSGKNMTGNNYWLGHATCALCEYAGWIFRKQISAMNPIYLVSVVWLEFQSSSIQQTCNRSGCIIISNWHDMTYWQIFLRLDIPMLNKWIFVVDDVKMKS